MTTENTKRDCWSGVCIINPDRHVRLVQLETGEYQVTVRDCHGRVVVDAGRFSALGPALQFFNRLCY